VEEGGERTDDHGWRTVGRGWRTEDGGWRIEEGEGTVESESDPLAICKLFTFKGSRRRY
jgi:hypothetical protein